MSDGKTNKDDMDRVSDQIWRFSRWLYLLPCGISGVAVFDEIAIQSASRLRELRAEDIF
jgi:hypothetical protein